MITINNSKKNKIIKKTNRKSSTKGDELISINARLKAAKIPEKQIAIITSNLNKLEKTGVSKDALENIVNNIISMKDVRAVFTKDNPVEKLKKFI